MEILDPGHVYKLRQLGGGTQIITFVKRSGGAIQYEHEWAGLQTQEVLRALIDRTKYLHDVLPCEETRNALQHLRMALFEYEARAYRRKRDGVNRKDGNHKSIDKPEIINDRPYHDVPFNEKDIECWPFGEDGHIVLNPEQ